MAALAGTLLLRNKSHAKYSHKYIMSMQLLYMISALSGCDIAMASMSYR